MTSLNSKMQLMLLNQRKEKNLLEKGFTLVELMVVIVIIGILSAVALPSLLGNKEIAARNSAQNVLSSSAKACQAAIVGGDDALNPDMSSANVQDVTFTPTGTVECSSATANIILTAAPPGNFSKWDTDLTATITPAGEVTYSWVTTTPTAP